MIGCLNLIDVDPGTNKDEAFFIQLNEARNALKHVGNLPNTNQWANVVQDVFQKLSALCQNTLGDSLDAIDESVLILNTDVRAHLDAAKQASALGQFKEALESIGRALCISLHDVDSLRAIVVGQPNAEDALRVTAFGISANEFLRSAIPSESVSRASDSVARC